MFKKIILTIIIALIPTISFAANDPCIEELAKKFTKVDTEWLESLESLSEQRKPSSTIVQHAISDLRTYQCKLDAVCEDLKYSISNSDKEAELPNIEIMGCFEQEPRQVEVLEICKSNSLKVYPDILKKCENKVASKKQEEKIFMKSVVIRDAARKQTGFLFIRYELILQKIHDQLSEHVRLMMGAFSRFADALPCAINQCD